MALEYSTILTPVESLQEAVDQKGMILFGLTSSQEAALLSPKAFVDIDFAGDINGPYETSDKDKLVVFQQIRKFFTSPNRGTIDYRGAQGIQGPVGPIGNTTTLRGYQGVKGEDAAVVAQGTQGYQGYNGIQGHKVTAQGAQGIQGPVGGDYKLTWERLNEVLGFVGVHLSDDGCLSGDTLKATEKIEAELGFYQSDGTIVPPTPDPDPEPEP